MEVLTYCLHKIPKSLDVKSRTLFAEVIIG